MIKKWMAEQIISAVVLAWGILLKCASQWVYDQSPLWRERVRQRWWRYKVKSLLTPGTNDDLRADAIGRYHKFETPPDGSGWTLSDGKYLPGPGSGYVRLPDGTYQCMR